MESYFILDELGSPIELMDEDGCIRESYSYDEFGRMYTDESHQGTTPLQPFGFTGYQMDEAGGLYYAQARRYDAVNGRFVSKDSDRYIRKMHPSSWNQYIYCDNNPEKYIDPSGNVYIIVWSYGTEEAEAFEEWYDKHFEGTITNPIAISYMMAVVGPINAPKTTGGDDPKTAPTADWTLHMWYEYCKRSSFARAAYTRYDEMTAPGLLGTQTISKEEIMVVRVDSEEDFIEKWNSWTQLESVQGIEIFSHGYSGEPNFYLGSTKQSFYNNILPKLNWESTDRCTDPHIIFYGCETADGKNSQALADYYGVTIYGNTLVTTFTENPFLYDRIDTFGTSHDVYLRQVVTSDNDIIRGWQNLTKGLGFGRKSVSFTIYEPQVTKE